MYLDLNNPYHTNLIDVPRTRTYTIDIVAIGAETVTVPVPPKVAEYWNSFDRDELATLIVDERRRLDETIDGAVIDPSFVCDVWQKSGDVVSLNGPSLDWSPDVRVTNEYGNVIFKKTLDPEAYDENVIVDERPEVSSDKSTFVARTDELVSQSYTFDSEGPLNFSLLKFRFSWFVDSLILTEVTYDAVPADIRSQGSRDYGRAIAGVIMLN